MNNNSPMQARQQPGSPAAADQQVDLGHDNIAHGPARRRPEIPLLQIPPRQELPIGGGDSPRTPDHAMEAGDSPRTPEQAIEGGQEQLTPDGPMLEPAQQPPDIHEERRLAQLERPALQLANLPLDNRVHRLLADRPPGFLPDPRMNLEHQFIAGHVFRALHQPGQPMHAPLSPGSEVSEGTRVSLSRAMSSPLSTDRSDRSEVDQPSPGRRLSAQFSGLRRLFGQ